MLSPKTLKIIFIILAVLCLLTSIYHVVGIFYKINDAPPLRHLLFVGVTLFCTYGFSKRPSYFVYVFGLLLLQQYYSHGGDVIKMWDEKRQIDWLSAGVLVALTLGMFCLVEEVRAKKTN